MTTKPANRILPYTRVLAVVIVPFLVAASFLLYVIPDQTDRTFAWTIAPSYTAMLLASAYIGGIWFFVQVWRQKAWHRVKYGFPAVVAFATLAGIATFLHWDRFHTGHISFLTWVGLYVTTPGLVLAAAVSNWRQDPGVPEAMDTEIPTRARMLLVAVGVGAMLTGLALFVFPKVFMNAWAWKLTPLTARITGAVMTLPGMVNIWMLRERRWSAFRWIFQAQLVSLVFIGVGILRANADIQWGRPVAWLFAGGIELSILSYAGFYLSLDRRLSARQSVPRAVRPSSVSA